MDSLTIVLIVVIGVVSVLQTVLLVRLAREGLRTARGLERLADRLVSDLTPAARDITRAAANATHLTESAVTEMHRVGAVVQEVSESWSQTTARVHQAVVPTVSRLALAAAGWRLARRGFRVYRRLRR